MFLHIEKTTEMEDDQNGRQPKWKTSETEDDRNGRQSKWKMTEMEDNQNVKCKID